MILLLKMLEEDIFNDVQFVVILFCKSTFNFNLGAASCFDLGVVISNILGWLSKLPISICFAYRRRNIVARALAKC